MATGDDDYDDDDYDDDDGEDDGDDENDENSDDDDDEHHGDDYDSAAVFSGSSEIHIMQFNPNEIVKKHEKYKMMTPTCKTNNSYAFQALCPTLVFC